MLDRELKGIAGTSELGGVGNSSMDLFHVHLKQELMVVKIWLTAYF